MACSFAMPFWSQTTQIIDFSLKIYTHSFGMYGNICMPSTDKPNSIQAWTFSESCFVWLSHSISLYFFWLCVHGLLWAIAPYLFGCSACMGWSIFHIKSGPLYFWIFDFSNLRQYSSHSTDTLRFVTRVATFSTIQSVNRSQTIFGCILIYLFILIVVFYFLFIWLIMFMPFYPRSRNVISVCLCCMAAISADDFFSENSH